MSPFKIAILFGFVFWPWVLTVREWRHRRVRHEWDRHLAILIAVIGVLIVSLAVLMITKRYPIGGVYRESPVLTFWGDLFLFWAAAFFASAIIRFRRSRQSSSN